MRFAKLTINIGLLCSLPFLSGCVFLWPSTPRPEFTKKTIQGPSSFEGTYSNNPKISLHTFIVPFSWKAPNLSYIMRVGRGINEEIDMLRFETAEPPEWQLTFPDQPSGWLQVTFLDSQGNELGTERFYPLIEGRTWVLRDYSGPVRNTGGWFVAQSGRERERAELYLGMTGNMIAYTGGYNASLLYVGYPVPIFGILGAAGFKFVYKRVD